MKDHTESVAIDYDPTVITYRDLLERFWASINPRARNWGRQYRHAIFYRNEGQQAEAEESRIRVAEKLSLPVDAIKTGIVSVKEFTYAEGYHQKYSLRKNREERPFLEQLYPTAKELADSSVATLLNAYLGKGMDKDWATFARDLPSFGLPDSLQKRLSLLAERRQ